MKRLFEKDEVLFAVLWIVVYVVGFSAADAYSESVGMPKLATCVFGLILSCVLFSFVRRNGLLRYVGLSPVKGAGRKFLWFAPLVLISCVNLCFGVTVNVSVGEAVCWVVSMCFVAFLEELIFRGLLFRGMCRNGLKTAVAVSSLTFGMGHIVNLLLGAPLFDTLLQLVYATAVGFCYTAVFYAGGSILPCILSHAVVNSTSIFAVETGKGGQLLLALAQTLLGVSYGVWLLRRERGMQEEKESIRQC